MNEFRLFWTKHQNLIIYKLLIYFLAFYIFITYPRVLPIWTYIMTLVGYAVINLGKLRKKFENYIHIFDLVLIMVILFGRNINSALPLALIALPIIFRNMYIELSSNEQYFALEYIILLLLMYLTPNCIDKESVIPIILFVVILFIINYRFAVKRKNDELYATLLDLVDNYYSTDVPTFKIYSKAITIIKRKIPVRTIICFTATNDLNHLHLYNSSQLIYKYSYEITERQKAKLLEGSIVRNLDLKIDGEQSSDNIVYPILSKDKESNLLFVLDLKPSNKFLFDFQIFDLENFFIRLSKVIYLDMHLREKKYEAIERLRIRGRFVNAAINTMHFIKNRLTPIQTLVDLLNNEGNIQQHPNFKKHLEKTVDRCANEIISIQQRSEYLLNKENDPFFNNKLSKLSIKRIYVLLRDIWSSKFPESNFIIEDIPNQSEQIEYKVDSNLNALEILFSDIIGNMYKYSAGYVRCEIKQNENQYFIRFYNSFKEKENVDLLISDMNTDEKDEIIFSKTHGIALIKQNIHDLHITSYASIINKENINCYFLELKFTLQIE